MCPSAPTCAASSVSLWCSSSAANVLSALSVAISLSSALASCRQEEGVGQWWCCVMMTSEPAQ
jgi:hypothetical protein